MKSVLPAPGSGRRVAAIVAAVSAVGLVATACAAGQIAETAKETVVNDAGGAQLGSSMSLQGVALQTPNGHWKSGDQALLLVVIANSGDQDDQLVGVSSPIASSVSLQGSSAQFITNPPASPSVSNPLSGSLASSASASVSPQQTVPSANGLSVPPGDTSPGSSPSFTSQTAGSANVPSVTTGGGSAQLPTPGVGESGSVSGGESSVTISPHTSLSFGYFPDNPAIVFTLNTDVYPAQPFPVTFTFKNAGSVTLTSTVKLDSSVPTTAVVPSLTATEG